MNFLEKIIATLYLLFFMMHGAVLSNTNFLSLSYFFNIFLGTIITASFFTFLEKLEKTKMAKIRNTTNKNEIRTIGIKLNRRICSQ